ncbi:MAG: BatA domain-containing protein [Pirellulales bacterium]
MSFLHLWPIYLGIAAAVLPVVVHWLTRPRPVKLPFSTLRFVREVVQQRRARHRLRDFAILALRTLAVLLLAWAVARPLLGTRSGAVADASISVARVVVVDVSQSMAASHGGIEAFERARSRAAEYLAHERGLRANLIRAGAAATATFDELSGNLAALHDELARLQAQPERLNVQPALALAARMLADAKGDSPRRELIVVSDFQRTNWTAADFSPLPADTIIRLESVAPAETPANLAILRVAVPGHPLPDRPSRVEVEIGNFSPSARPVACELTLGEATYRLEGLCPAQAKTVLAEDVVLPAAGWQTGQARLVDQLDALAADNVRACVVEVHTPAPFVLITRQRPDDVRASSFFLERALAPYLPGERDDGPRVVRIDPGRMDADRLATAELVILDHPGKLSVQSTGILAGLLRRGKAIWYLAAEPTDAVNLKQLVDEAGTSLQMPVEFSPPEVGRRRRDLFWADLKQNQAPFAIFGDSLKSAASSLRFAGGLASRRLEGGLADDLVAEYGDRSAALVISSSGAGMLAVLNADLGSSNLPASPMFVPLVDQLVDRMLGDRRGAAPIASGEPMAVYLPAEVRAAERLVIASDAKPADASLGELVNEGPGVVWRMTAAAPPGIYRVNRDQQTVFAVAIELPAEESDLRMLAREVLEDRLAGGRDVRFRATDENEDRDDLWTWLAVAATLAMLVELAVLRIVRA